MFIKKGHLLMGILLSSIALYKAYTFKIGPCSPELEDMINRKENGDQKLS